MKTAPMRLRHPDAKLSFRLPSEMVGRWRTEAAARGVNLSDLLRLTLATALAGGEADGAVTTRRPPPRRRSAEGACGRAAAADPALLRQLAWIGNNLNQLARVANTTGTTDVRTLLALQRIRIQLDTLITTVAVAPGSLPEQDAERC